MVNRIEQSQIIDDNNKMNELISEFERLKSIFECPRLYICNHFNELRCQVDLSFCQKLNTTTNEKMKNQLRTELNESWTEIIKSIDTFETKCLRHKPSNKFNTILSQEIIQKIKFIDRIIKQLSLNLEDQSTQIKYVCNLVYDEIFKIEKIIFLNQTLMFLDETKCKIKNLFNKFTSKSSAGKLLVIRNEYFGKKSIDYLQNPENFNHEKLKNELVKCKELKKVLENNATSDCIDEIWLNFANLTELNFSDNNLKSLDAGTLIGLNGLTLINLSSNHISEADKEIFNGLSNLTHLYLGYNQLNSLDCSIFSGLNKLTHITINNNQLQAINQQTFKGLNNLQVIQLNYNRLTSIEENTFNGLTNLEIINLSNNKLKSVNKLLFKDLINLKEINLSNNQLDAIDSSTFNELEKLTQINLSFNSITSLGRSIFRNLRRLTSLRLNNNRLALLDKTIFQGLHRLKDLHLDNNQIVSLDSHLFRSLLNLEIIYLHYNKLKSIHSNTFESLKQLKEIHLDNNYITSIDSNLFKGLINLEEIHLNKNRITSLQENKSHDSYFNYGRLQYLSTPYYFNKYSMSNDHNNRKLFSGLFKLRIINLNDNLISSLDSNTFNGLKQLKTINLSNNLLRNNDRRGLQTLPIQWNA